MSLIVAAASTETYYSNKQVVEGATSKYPRCVMFEQISTEEKRKVDFKLLSLHLVVDVFFSQAYISYQGTWKLTDPINTEYYNTSLPQKGFLFQMPLYSSQTALSSTVIHPQTRRMFDTALISNDHTSKLAPNKEMGKAIELIENINGKKVNEYDPTMMNQPFYGINKGDTVVAQAEILDEVPIHKNNYRLRLPLEFPSSVSQDELINVNVEIKMHAGSVPNKCNSPTHTVKNIKQDASYTSYTYSVSTTNQEFEFIYGFGNDYEITAAAFYQPTGDNRGNFTALIFPPRSQAEAKIGKDVVFLLDVSGSMGASNSLEPAKEAISVALDQLNETDRFAICAFSDKQAWFSPNETYSTNVSPKEIAEMSRTNETFFTQSQLFQKSPIIISKAKSWIVSLVARGGTNILAPLQQSYARLGVGSPNQGSYRHRIVFLITDGAVENDSEIYQYVSQTMCDRTKESSNHPYNACSLSTFGIGSDYNSLFLKLLASVGHGVYDSSRTRFELKDKMVNLFAMSWNPIIKNISIKPQFQTTIIESFTNDLTNSSPVIIHGATLDNVVEQTIAFSGIQLYQNTNEWSCHCKAEVGPAILMGRMIAKKRIDLAAAESWLEQSNQNISQEKKREVIQYSIESGIPSPYTQIISYETALPIATAVSVDFSDVNSEKPKRKIGKAIPKGAHLIGASVGMAAFGAIATAVPAAPYSRSNGCCSWNTNDSCNCDCDCC